MGDQTGISWTDATWNPVTGCSKVSPGCAHCYAEKLSLRGGKSKLPWTPQNAEQNVVLHPDRLDRPLHWRAPRRVLVNSMSDLFHEQVPFDFIGRVFEIMAAADQHIFQVLTKRPQRMLEFVLQAPAGSQPLPNVWLGVSVENQRWADERIPLLLQTPAAVRFISAEPLLGSVNLDGYLGDDGLDWVIVGGESGRRRREMNIEWARSIREQCRATGVAYFGKQDSGPRPGSPLPGNLSDKEWPQGHTLGVTRFEPRSWEDIVLDGCKAARQTDTGQWRLGDLALEVDTTRSYGSGRATKFARSIGVEPSRLRKLKVVAQAFPEEVRAAHILPFAHFEEVYRRDDAKLWLRRAARKGWPRDQMRQEIWKADHPIHDPGPIGGPDTSVTQWFLPKETKEQRRARAARATRQFCRDAIYDPDAPVASQPRRVEQACLWIASGPTEEDEPERVSGNDVTRDDWLALRDDLEKLIAAIDKRLRRAAA